MSILVVVESPTKVATIKGYLGKGYKVVASKGHVRDLPKSKIGVDIENGFAPSYINIRGKGELISSLKKEAEKASSVLLATDPDREGEAISWHLAAALKLDMSKTKRISFNEITKSTLQEAINHPREIDMNLVDSQQARRILDRLVGYKLSPFLWKKIKNGLSAGRVQSVATRIIVERENEIRNFISEEYWNITALLNTADGAEIAAKYYGDKKGKKEVGSKEEADRILAETANGLFTVTDEKRAVKHRRAQPPYTTSTLQQDANRRLGFQAQRTMTVAQELYEGMSLGESGTHGLITYMRTDSLRVSDEARAAAKEFIVKTFGAAYYPEVPNTYKVKKNSQDAHEAIRPADVSLVPAAIKKYLNNDQYRLYKMIWERFVASQMKQADLDTVLYTFDCNGNVFKAGGYVVKFRGYMAAYGSNVDTKNAIEEPDSDDDSEFTSKKLPQLNIGDKLTLKSMDAEQQFTQPPSRYTDGTLTKVLAEMGIGRPSTFAPTITTIITRGYVVREGKFLKPTPVGEVTTELMLKSFPSIVDYNYTAHMEDSLEDICEGKLGYVDVLNSFYGDFMKLLEQAEKELEQKRIEIPSVPTGIICDKCGAEMIERNGRFGKFAACPRYPECKNTAQLTPKKETKALPEQSAEVYSEKCSKCGADMILKKGAYGSFYACKNYPECKNTIPYQKSTGIACPICKKDIVIKQSKSKRTFYSCSDYPNCQFSCWDIPQEGSCPKCGGLLLCGRGKNKIYCYNTECGWKLADNTSGDKKKK